MMKPLRIALAHIADRSRNGIDDAKGSAFRLTSLSGHMKDWTADAGLAPGYLLHGLRKPMGGDMADAGSTAREAMALLNHASTDNFTLTLRARIKFAVRSRRLRG